MAKKIRVWDGTEWVPVAIQAPNMSSFATKEYVDSFADNFTRRNEIETLPLDSIAEEFNGGTTRFAQKHKGVVISNFNPFRLIISVNGVIQDYYTQDSVWLSMFPRYGFTIDSEGMILFSEAPETGSTFLGRILPGSNQAPEVSIYPFKPIDIMLGI